MCEPDRIFREVPEVPIQSLASERLKSTRPEVRRASARSALMTLSKTFASPFRAPVNRCSRGTGARGPFRACSAHNTRLLDGGLRHTYAGRDWTRSQQRGCSPPPRPADTGGSGLGVWRATRSRGALTSMPSSSADAESGPRAEIMRRSGHGDRTHYIRHHHD